MQTVATALPVNRLRRFPSLARHLDSSSSTPGILFLHDDFVLRAGPSRSSAEVYRDNSPGWAHFCTTGEALDADVTPAPDSSPRPPIHEWNQDFEWRDVSGPLEWLTQSQAEQYNRDGWCLLEDVVPEDTVMRLIQEVDRLERVAEARLRRMQQGAFIARADEITFTTHIVRNSPVVRDFYRSPLFCGIAKDIIGPDVRLYWDQAVYKKPFSPHPFPWHQDNGYTFVDPQQYLTCWVALTDSTRANGCLQMMPGEHRRGTFQHRRTKLGYICYEEDPATAVSLEVKAGTVVCMSATTPHQTGPNSTDAVRRALVAQFAPEGAEAITREANGRVARLESRDPVRQFPILVAGQPSQ